MAVSVLNGLVGNIDVSGGLLIPRTVPLQPLPSFEKDATARKGLHAERIDGTKRSSPMLQQPYLFARNVVSGKPYRPEVLFLYYTNPLFSNPGSDLFSKAFAEIPLIVSFSPYMDDTSSMADIILPDHTPLERWQDDSVSLNNGFPVLGIRQPVIEPLYQTRATGDVLLQMTRSLGGEIEKAFPWKDFREVLLHGIRGVFDAGRGDTFGLPFEQSWTRLLEKGGWWAPSYRTFEEFWQQLQDKGGWWDPIYDSREWNRVLRTPSKRFQLYAQPGEQAPAAVLPTGTEKASFLPHWEESKMETDEKAYPLQLHTFRTMALFGSRNANQPWLQSIVGGHLFEEWETWVEINPETAKRLEISDRDWVWVESPRGKIKVRARHYKGAMPEVVSIPLGEGHQSGGRWAAGLGKNPYDLLRNDLDPMTGYPISRSTRVKIYKA
jgi:anaerobic selenocysteine-containing dehydrogenase